MSLVTGGPAGAGDGTAPSASLPSDPAHANTQSVTVSEEDAARVYKGAKKN